MLSITYLNSNIQPALNRLSTGNMFNQDLLGLLSNVLGWLLLLAAVFIFLCILISGVQWITSSAGGSTSGIEDARNRLTACIIGFAVLATSYAVAILVQYFLGISVIQMPGTNFVGPNPPTYNLCQDIVCAANTTCVEGQCVPIDSVDCSLRCNQINNSNAGGLCRPAAPGCPLGESTISGGNCGTDVCCCGAFAVIPTPTPIENQFVLNLTINGQPIANNVRGISGTSRSFPLGTPLVYSYNIENGTLSDCTPELPPPPAGMTQDNLYTGGASGSGNVPFDSPTTQYAFGVTCGPDGDPRSLKYKLTINYTAEDPEITSFTLTGTQGYLGTVNLGGTTYHTFDPAQQSRFNIAWAANNADTCTLRGNGPNEDVNPVSGTKSFTLPPGNASLALEIICNSVGAPNSAREIILVRQMTQSVQITEAYFWQTFPGLRIGGPPYEIPLNTAYQFRWNSTGAQYCILNDDATTRYTTDGIYPGVLTQPSTTYKVTCINGGFQDSRQLTLREGNVPQGALVITVPSNFSPISFDGTNAVYEVDSTLIPFNFQLSHVCSVNTDTKQISVNGSPFATFPSLTGATSYTLQTSDLPLNVQMKCTNSNGTIQRGLTINYVP